MLTHNANSIEELEKFIYSLNEQGLTSRAKRLNEIFIVLKQEVSAIKTERDNLVALITEKCL